MSREDLVQEIIEGLSRLQRPIDHKSWKAFSLSQAQISMLYMLYCHQQASVKQVANHMGVSQSAVTQLIDPLITKGLVARGVDPKDRRIARLSVTIKGKNLLKKIRKLKTAGLRVALNNLSTVDVEHFGQIVKKMSAGYKSGK